ncbi:hypothetical protein [Sinorhizobium fredii]|uniref:Uncharacterized protein n=1 Tax=Rhizobium fredii TaxID=380 RepID=A0A2A6LY24_RHIFR|nr:hypothetical protein [Sinorhizobium fredii]PDT47454.1 hypothetical protein CO661_11975 [Sinorhizobium fredii]
MKTILTFEGQDIESMSREELIGVVKFMAAENDKTQREVTRLHRNQTETFRRLADMRTAH